MITRISAAKTINLIHILAADIKLSAAKIIYLKYILAADK